MLDFGGLNENKDPDDFEARVPSLTFYYLFVLLEGENLGKGTVSWKVTYLTFFFFSLV